MGLTLYFYNKELIIFQEYKKHSISLINVDTLDVEIDYKEVRTKTQYVNSIDNEERDY